MLGLGRTIKGVEDKPEMKARRYWYTFVFDSRARKVVKKTKKEFQSKVDKYSNLVKAKFNAKEFNKLQQAKPNPPKKKK